MGGRGGASHRGSGGWGVAAKDFLTRAYGERHANAVMGLLSNAPEYVQEMWKDFAGSFKAAWTDPRSNAAYYAPVEDKVYLNIERVARGDSISTPYSTVFHEYGHMTDYLIARRLGYGSMTAYTEVYKNGLLGRTAKEEMKAHLARAREAKPWITTDSLAARYIINEINLKYSVRDRSDISDIMEGAGIGVEYPLGAGHGLNYWRGRDNGKEIFAEITSAEAAHPGSLKAIKEYFPKTYEVYLDMVKERKRS